MKLLTRLRHGNLQIEVARRRSASLQSPIRTGLVRVMRSIEKVNEGDPNRPVLDQGKLSLADRENAGNRQKV